jgi:hypothetical protein
MKQRDNEQTGARVLAREEEHQEDDTLLGVTLS